MTKLRVVTWNAGGMFVEGSMTRRASPHDAITALKKLNADVLVIPEFGVHGSIDAALRTAIQSLGYQIVEVPYEDKTMPSHVPENYEMAVLSRLPVVSTMTHRLAHTRNCVEVLVKSGDQKLRVFGVHLDDKSENTRMSQAADLVHAVVSDTHTPTIMMGDFNAMHHASTFAMFTRSKIVRRLSQGVRHAQLRSVVDRLHEMALGTTIAYIEEYSGLQNLDTGHHHTVSAKQAGMEWAPTVRLAKIDWVFGSTRLRVHSYRVFHDVGSDHRPVVVDIEL